MSVAVKYFAWNYLRAFLWIGAVAFALYRGTRNARIARSFIAAHLVALGVGIASDVFLVNFAPASWKTIDVLQWFFAAPIVIFTAISLWIGDREKPMHAPDALVTMIPIAMWGLMVIYGWQRMWDCHILGAWFVSAASGGVDLYTRCGPAWIQRRSWPARLAGYVLVVAVAYLLVPRTELRWY